MSQRQEAGIEDVAAAWADVPAVHVAQQTQNGVGHKFGTTASAREGIQAHGSGIVWIDDYDIIDPARRDSSEDIVDYVALGLNHNNGDAGLDVLDDSVHEQG